MITWCPTALNEQLADRHEVGICTLQKRRREDGGGVFDMIGKPIGTRPVNPVNRKFRSIFFRSQMLSFTIIAVDFTFWYTVNASQPLILYDIVFTHHVPSGRSIVCFGRFNIKLKGNVKPQRNTRWSTNLLHLTRMRFTPKFGGYIHSLRMTIKGLLILPTLCRRSH